LLRCSRFNDILVCDYDLVIGCQLAWLGDSVG
jgi:hypothetical protein